jgi:hypothetical protein
VADKSRRETENFSIIDKYVVQCIVSLARDSLLLCRDSFPKDSIAFECSTENLKSLAARPHD